MEQITRKKEVKTVEDAILRWKSIAGNKLPDCFEKFFANKNGIQDQRQRLSAIRFGKVTDEFKKLLGDDKNQLWLRLALFPETEVVTRTLEITEGDKKPKKVEIKETVVAREVFSVVLKVVTKEEQDNKNDKEKITYFTSSSIKNLLTVSDSVLSPGLQYGANRSSEYTLNSNVELIGLRPVVSNEMCMNWCLIDPYKIPGLFNVIQPDLSGMVDAQRVFYQLTESLGKDKNKKLEELFNQSLNMTTEAVYDPFNSTVVRAHGYKVNGYDLAGLRANIKNSNQQEVDSYFTIHLGMKDGGANFNEGQFSLVTEFMEAASEPVPVKGVQSFDDLTKDGKKDLIMKFTNEQALFAPGIGLEGTEVRFWVNNKHAQGEVTAKSHSDTSNNKISLIEEDTGWEFDFQSYSSSFDDFLHPCPPLCGSDPDGNP